VDIYKTLHQIDLFWVIKSIEDKMGGAWRAHWVGENAHKILSEKLKGRDYLKNRPADGRIILQWILNK
jgi:hypothetical protein